MQNVWGFQQHIPAKNYHDCVEFIRRTYERMIGETLSGEQLRLLDDDEQ